MLGGSSLASTFPDFSELSLVPFTEVMGVTNLGGLEESEPPVKNLGWESLGSDFLPPGGPVDLPDMSNSATKMRVELICISI
jgi:hypothetical protein